MGSVGLGRSAEPPPGGEFAWERAWLAGLELDRVAELPWFCLFFLLFFLDMLDLVFVSGRGTVESSRIEGIEQRGGAHPVRFDPK
ncbi:hypothetical protein GKIL_2355 [Gloeobacter kilaueensis JS1]|uniref:Uncharacterized protein n=1 Tax=Gloeobacter kilaueensis (strain ATCC BAA-2537 / CCAP 1431/1 / ULC 316 / JS1) TaxID=1183438 RepID=U5QI41_GLOK1|nr:hypothetical protein GKIL_2355 [Gloeobacter kilaueensis JS1]